MLLNLGYTHYDIYVEFEQDIVIEMFNEMKDFISEIKSYLKN